MERSAFVINSLIGLLVAVYLATGLGAILRQRRRGQRPIENYHDPEQPMLPADPQPRLSQLLQNVEDREEVERNNDPNPPDDPAAHNVLPPDNGLLNEQYDSASVNTHAEEEVGLDGQESEALAPVPSTSGNGSF